MLMLIQIQMQTISLACRATATIVRRRQGTPGLSADHVLIFNNRQSGFPLLEDPFCHVPPLVLSLFLSPPGYIQCFGGSIFAVSLSPEDCDSILALTCLSLFPSVGDAIDMARAGLPRPELSSHNYFQVKMDVAGMLYNMVDSSQCHDACAHSRAAARNSRYVLPRLR